MTLLATVWPFELDRAADTADRRHQKLLTDAVTLMGRAHVAAALHVGEATLEAWLKGEANVPGSKLILLAQAAVDFANGLRR